jgi:hypothetical protein
VRPLVVAAARVGAPARGLVQVRVGLAPGPSSEAGEQAATARVLGVRRPRGQVDAPVRVPRVVRIPTGAPGGPGLPGHAVRRSRARVAGQGVLQENVGHPGKRGVLVAAGTAVQEPVRDDPAQARGTTGSDRHRRSAGAPGAVSTAPEATAVVRERVVRERVVRSGTIVAGGGGRVTSATEERAGRGRCEQVGSQTAVRA